jgi:hypothetical protein
MVEEKLIEENIGVQLNVITISDAIVPVTILEGIAVPDKNGIVRIKCGC